MKFGFQDQHFIKKPRKNLQGVLFFLLKSVLLASAAPATPATGRGHAPYCFDRIFIFFLKINHVTSSNLYRFYYPHRSRELVSPVCGIFSIGKEVVELNETKMDTFLVLFQNLWII